MSVDGDIDTRTFYSAYSFPPQTKTYVYPSPMMYPPPMAFIPAPMPPTFPHPPVYGAPAPVMEPVRMRRKEGETRPIHQRRPASFHHLPQPYPMAMMPPPGVPAQYYSPYQSMYYPCMSVIPPESAMDLCRTNGSGKSSSKSSDYAKFEEDEIEVECCLRSG